VSNFDALFDFLSGPNHDGQQLVISYWVLEDCSLLYACKNKGTFHLITGHKGPEEE
jgi:hypothetical protein